MEKGRGKRTDTLPTDNVFTRKEYIEREAALEEVDNADVMCDIQPDAYRVLRRYIERIPASDVVSRDCYDRLLVENDELRKERPVVHGRWIDVEVKELAYYKMMIASMRCDRCGRYHNEVYHYGNPTEMAKYCGFCGALMDKDGDGE